MVDPAKAIYTACQTLYQSTDRAVVTYGSLDAVLARQEERSRLAVEIQQTHAAITKAAEEAINYQRSNITYYKTVLGLSIAVLVVVILVVVYQMFRMSSDITSKPKEGAQQVLSLCIVMTTVCGCFAAVAAWCNAGQQNAEGSIKNTVYMLKELALEPRMQGLITLQGGKVNVVAMWASIAANIRSDPLSMVRQLQQLGKDVQSANEASIIKEFYQPYTLQRVQEVLANLDVMARLVAIRDRTTAYTDLMVSSDTAPPTAEEVRASIDERVLPLLSRRLYKFALAAAQVRGTAVNVTSGTATDCLQTCFEDNDCGALSYDPNTRSCKLCHGSTFELVKDDAAPQSMVYLTDDVTVLPKINKELSGIYNKDTPHDDSDVASCISKCQGLGSAACNSVIRPDKKCYMLYVQDWTNANLQDGKLDPNRTIHAIVHVGGGESTTPNLVADSNTTLTVNRDVLAALIAKEFYALGDGVSIRDYTDYILQKLKVGESQLHATILRQAAAQLDNLRSHSSPVQYVTMKEFVAKLNSMTYADLARTLDIKLHSQRIADIVRVFSNQASGVDGASIAPELDPTKITDNRLAVGRVLLITGCVVAGLLMLSAGIGQMDASWELFTGKALFSSNTNKNANGNAANMDKALHVMLNYAVPLAIFAYCVCLVANLFSSAEANNDFNKDQITQNSRELQAATTALYRQVAQLDSRLTQDMRNKLIKDVPGLTYADKNAMYDSLKLILDASGKSNFVSLSGTAVAPFPVAQISVRVIVVVVLLAALFGTFSRM
eukprot:jgi/Chrzof1/7991/UNPLg00042.t1